MPERYMLDTDICIYIRRRRPNELWTRFNRLRPGEAVISLITYGELRHGAEKSQDRSRALGMLEDLVASLRVEPLPIGAAEAYASIRFTLESKGEVIGNNDLWIAAHARTSGFTLVTNNEREFRRVPGLTVENWARA